MDERDAEAERLMAEVERLIRERDAVIAACIYIRADSSTPCLYYAVDMPPVSYSSFDTREKAVAAVRKAAGLDT